MNAQTADGHGTPVARVLAKEPDAVILPGVVLNAALVFLHNSECTIRYSRKLSLPFRRRSGKVQTSCRGGSPRCRGRELRR